MVRNLYSVNHKHLHHLVTILLPRISAAANRMPPSQVPQLEIILQMIMNSQSGNSCIKDNKVEAVSPLKIQDFHM